MAETTDHAARLRAFAGTPTLAGPIGVALLTAAGQIDRLTRTLRLIRDGCSSPDAVSVGMRACYFLADAALGGEETTTAQREWAVEFAEKYAEEPTPP